MTESEKAKEAAEILDQTSKALAEIGLLLRRSRACLSVINAAGLVPEGATGDPVVLLGTAQMGLTQSREGVANAEARLLEARAHLAMAKAGLR